ncbi:FixH family protein [Oceanobacillus sp. CAU 1775]
MKKILLALLGFTLLFLVACGSNDEVDEVEEELPILAVDFKVPESAEVDEVIELEAIVTYGGDPVENADEVKFEYWLMGDEDNSEEIDGVHTENGAYVAEVTFSEDGVYEMYAHTTAEGLHTMPLTSITIGDGGDVVEEEEHEHAHTDGFHSHFDQEEVISAGEETELVVHLQMDGEPLSEVSVRYEVVPDGNPQGTNWIDAEEISPGEYEANHTFSETGTYKVVVHVEDDADLHEHDEYTVTVE